MMGNGANKPALPECDSSSNQTDSMSAALYVVSLEGWEPSQQQFDQLLQLCPAGRVERVRKFHFEADSRRCLASHLLQLKACVDVAGATADNVQFGKTKGNKPFAIIPDRSDEAPNFNYNASHDGDFVVLIAHSHCLCGIDVTRITDSVEEIADMTLTTAELATMHSIGAAMRNVYIHAIFACKEAYTKALGVGIVRDMNQIEFSPAIPVPWVTERDGAAVDDMVMLQVSDSEGYQGDWCLQSCWLDHSHFMVTALGSVKHAVDANGEFKRGLKMPTLPLPMDRELLRVAPTSVTTAEFSTVGGGAV